MASKQSLNPPVLSNIEEIDSWLYDLQKWHCVTDLEKKQQGPFIYFSLPVRNAYKDNLVANVDQENGLDTLI